MQSISSTTSPGEEVWHKVGELTPKRISVELRTNTSKTALVIAPGGATKLQSDLRISQTPWELYQPGCLWIVGHRERYHDSADALHLLRQNATVVLPPVYFEYFQWHTGTQGISIVNLLLKHPHICVLYFSTARYHNRRFLATFLQQWRRGGDGRQLWVALVDSPDPEVVTGDVDTNQTIEGEIERLNAFMGDDVPELNFVLQVVEQGYIQNP